MVFVQLYRLRENMNPAVFTHAAAASCWSACPGCAQPRALVDQSILLFGTPHLPLPLLHHTPSLTFKCIVSHLCLPFPPCLGVPCLVLRCSFLFDMYDLPLPLLPADLRRQMLSALSHEALKHMSVVQGKMNEAALRRARQVRALYIGFSSGGKT